MVVIPPTSVVLTEAIAEESTEPIEPVVVFPMPTMDQVAKKKASVPMVTSTKSKREEKGDCGAYAMVPEPKGGFDFADDDISSFNWYAIDSALTRGDAGFHS